MRQRQFSIKTKTKMQNTAKKINVSSYYVILNHNSLCGVSDLRKVNVGWGTLVTMTFGLVVWGIVVDSLGVMGNAKLVGVTTLGVWNRRLAKSSSCRSGSGRSASESLLSYPNGQAACVELCMPSSLVEYEPVPILSPYGHHPVFGTYIRYTHTGRVTRIQYVQHNVAWKGNSREGKGILKFPHFITKHIASPII